MAGRWAVALNVEGTKRLLARPSGPLREVALLGFADFGVVDSMAIPSSPAGRAATTLYDGGVGVTTRQQVGDLEWTLRFEVPLIVNRFDFARDVRPGQNRVQGTGIDLTGDRAYGQEQRQEAGQVVDDVHAEQGQGGERQPDRQTRLGVGRVAQRESIRQAKAEREQRQVAERNQDAGQDQPPTDRLLEREAGDQERVHRSLVASTRPRKTSSSEV